MPYQLLLMRHAKSDHGDLSLSDHDRPLSPRGRADAPFMAQWLARMQLVPSLILCSTALRTRETAELMLDRWSETQTEVVHCESLYLASAEAMLWTLASEHRGLHRVMLLAHNPGISMLSSVLSRKALSMPTSAIAAFDCSVDAAADRSDHGFDHENSSSVFDSLASSSDVALTHFVTPKELVKEPDA